MRFHGTVKAVWRTAATTMHRASLSSVAVAILLTGCTKQHPQSRYDWAMELAKTYSLGEVPKDFTAALRDPLDKDNYMFLDLIWGIGFSGKFQAAAEQLSKQSYFQPDNASMLAEVVNDSKLACFMDDESPTSNINCRDGDPFKADSVRLLHTDIGNFIFSSADQYRGNGHETNENASPLVVVIDPTDGGLGLILEDHIAVVGSHPDALSAALTLASSIVRLEGINRQKVQLTAIRYDLEAAKAHTLFRKSGGESENLSQSDTTDTDIASAQADTAAPKHLTKDQFRNIVLGKSMAEIREELGSPSNTDDGPDGAIWFYWSTTLPVEDPDSGTIVHTSAIEFSRSTNIAVGVHF